VTSPTPALRRNNPIAAVLMLIAASMAALAVTGTVPVLFVALALAFTAAAFFFAIRGRFRAQ
jgi:hypothetical protein